MHPARWAVGLAVTLVAVPILVLDNLPEGPSAGAVETVETAKDATTTSTEMEQELADSGELALMAAPETTAPPTTAPPTTAPPTTAPPTTAPPTTVPPTTAPPTTAPPTTAPPTTAPPTTAPPPPPASATTVAGIIRSVFGAHGDAAVAVARCESGLNPNARSANGLYHGLFQIGSGHASAFQRVTGRPFSTGWYDPTANATYAYHLFQSSGWRSWPHCGAGL